MAARGIWAIGGLVVVAAVAALYYAHQPAIEPLAAQPTADRFDELLVRRGAELAAIGNCGTCHTAVGGKPYAGGLAVDTPFGTIHSTNITPDPENGIGLWPEAAFNRSMRAGVDRAGNHLYPAFPYDHFTRVTDEYNRALYAFLMTRQAVAEPAPANDLAFPFSMRPLIAGWKLLFFKEGAYQPDSQKSAEWNHGAYLAEGLSHCGACHTPRNLLGAVKADAHYAGAELQGWYAYAINEASPAPIPWTAEKLAFYLRHGFHQENGISRGPMAPVTTNLATVPEADTVAIATYVADRMGAPSAERQQRGERILKETGSATLAPSAGDTQSPPPPASGEHPGAALYAAACASCHSGQRPLPFGGIDLHRSTGITGPTPQNAINVVLDGLPAAPGQPSPIMPGYDGAISDAQLVDLLTYMRERFSDEPPWQNVEAYVRQRRERGASVEASHGLGAPPADPAHRVQPW